MEGQILLWFLKVFKLSILYLILLIVLLYPLNSLYFKELATNNNYFSIEKNQRLGDVIDKNLNNNTIDLIIYKIILKYFILNEKKLHYGKFLISDNDNFFDLVEKITSPSNFYEKITIVEGWSKNDLKIELNNHFKEYQLLEYHQVIADTYFFNEGASYIQLKNILMKNYDDVKRKFNKSKLSEKFSFKDILIIGSLLEKEGIGYEDKKNIYSVIINRLNKNMKLQIDATVIYSLTKGESKLDRKLTYKDLKTKDKFNTYYIYGLPPEPISYVGLKTIEIILENYKTNYLFYFYNKYEDRHIFSVNYNKHLKRLNEYRSK